MLEYPQEAAWQEAAFLAVHSGFGPEQIMGIPHGERRQWVESIGRYLRAQARAAQEAEPRRPR